MTEIFEYIIESSVILIAWMILYKMLFSRETFFTLNRYLLIIGLLVSLFAPLIEIKSELSIIENSKILNNKSVFENTIISSDINEIKQNKSTINENQKYSNYYENNTIIKDKKISIYSIFMYLYIIGLGAFAGIFIYKLIRIYKTIKYDNIGLIKYKDAICYLKSYELNAFSFLNSICISKNDFDSEHSQKIIEHEYLHIKKYHTYDLIGAELIKTIFWFNPLYYIYIKLIRDNHEFEIDSLLVKQEKDKSDYFKSLAGQVIGAQFIDMPSYFNKSTLKRRFEMLNKEKSKNAYKAKYFVLVPVLMLVFVVFSCKKDEKEHFTLKEKLLLEQPYQSSDYNLDTYSAYSDAKKIGSLEDYKRESYNLLPLYMGLDSNMNAGELTFKFDISEKGKLENIELTDTLWFLNVPTERKKKFYSAMAYNYFAGSKTWKPKYVKGKPVKSSHIIKLFFGSKINYFETHQPHIISRNKYLYKNYRVAIHLPEIEKRKRQAFFPLVFNAQKGLQFIDLLDYNPTITMKGISGTSRVEFDIDEFGDVINIKPNKVNNQDIVFTNAANETVIKALKKMPKFNPRVQNNKAVKIHLVLETYFVSKNADNNTQLDLLGYAL